MFCFYLEKLMGQLIKFETVAYCHEMLIMIKAIQTGLRTLEPMRFLSIRNIQVADNIL